ncbi:MAG: hypothetical protein R3D03_21495 [Geminicoccaceae bacterium]
MLNLTLQRVDSEAQDVELRLARLSRDPAISCHCRRAGRVDADLAPGRLRRDVQVEPLEMQRSIMTSPHRMGQTT